MKKLLLVLSLAVIGLSGCYIKGHHDEGYHRGHDHDRGHDEHRDEHRDGRDGDHDDRHR